MHWQKRRSHRVLQNSLRIKYQIPEIFIKFGHIFEENGCSNLAIDAFQKDP